MQKLFTFILLVWTLQAGAQSPCYVPLTDASGFTPTQTQLNELEAAACRLRDSLPAEFQSSFKVFDFGFYLHNETTTGGYPEAFQMAIQQAQAQSDYYLLFGKQTDQNGMYTKFWVDLVLPDTGVFYCINQLSSSLRDDLTAKYGIIANLIHDGNEKERFRFHEVEITTMDSLLSYITSLKECCLPSGQQRPGSSCTSCAFTSTEFGLDLINKGFIATENQFKLGEVESTGMSSDVIGRTNMLLEVDGDTIEIDKQMSGIAERYILNNPGKTIKIYLNQYDDLCGSFDVTYNQFLDNESNAKIFIVAIQFAFNQVRLYFYYDGELGISEVNAIEFVKGLPDHYFDLAGNYLGKDEGNWSRIRVINKPLSEVSGLYKDESKKLIKKSVGEPNSVNLSSHITFVYGQGGDPNGMFSKIGGYYATQAGILKPITLAEGTPLAWVKSDPPSDTIYINKNPSIEFRNSYFELTNVIFHEYIHLVTKKGRPGFPCDHLIPVYLEQIKHPSFAKCSFEYKHGIIRNISCYIISCWNQGDYAGGGSTNAIKLMNEFNMEIKKYNLTIQISNNGSAGFESKILNLNTQQISTFNCNDYESL